MLKLRPLIVPAIGVPSTTTLAASSASKVPVTAVVTLVTVEPVAGKTPLKCGPVVSILKLTDLW